MNRCLFAVIAICCSLLQMPVGAKPSAKMPTSFTTLPSTSQRMPESEWRQTGSDIYELRVPGMTKQGMAVITVPFYIIGETKRNGVNGTLLMHLKDCVIVKGRVQPGNPNVAGSMFLPDIGTRATWLSVKGTDMTWRDWLIIKNPKRSNEIITRLKPLSISTLRGIVAEKERGKQRRGIIAKKERGKQSIRNNTDAQAQTSNASAFPYKARWKDAYGNMLDIGRDGKAAFWDGNSPFKNVTWQVRKGELSCRARFAEGIVYNFKFIPRNGGEKIQVLKKAVQYRPDGSINTKPGSFTDSEFRDFAILDKQWNN